MSSRQRFRDLILLLKRDRKAQVIAFAVAVLLVWGFTGDKNPRRMAVQGPTPLAKKGSGAMPSDEAYKDLVTSISSDINVIKKQTNKNSEDLNAYRQYVQQQEERTAEIFKRVLERISDIEANAQVGNASGLEPVNVSPEDLPDLDENTLTPWGNLDEEEVAPPTEPEDERIAFIGAGDSVAVKLLAGVDAPTDGTPYPVVFKLMSDVDGPDGSALPLGEARLIAAAQGSLSNRRALFRLTHMNVRYPDGSRQVQKVDGWVVGEDGLRGMEGVLIDPMGKAIVGSLASGTLEGLGDGVQASNRMTVVTNQGLFSANNGDIAEFAIAGGLGKAGERWSRFIDERARQLVPHVRVFSGREATAVFSQNIEMPGLFKELESEQSFQFASLD